MTNSRIAAWPALLVAALVGGCAAIAPDVSPKAGATPVVAGVDPETDISQAADGYWIAREHCAACHAIDATSPSPRADAPPLRRVLEIVPEDMLAEHFIEGVRIGHDDMPRFDFTVRAADALVVYLKSVQAPKRRGRKAASGNR